MSDYIGLDFETYSPVDLNKHGLENYIADPHFQPLIACTFDGLTAHLVDLYRNDTRRVEMLVDQIRGKWVVAHNVGFERAVLRWLGIEDVAAGYIDSAMIGRAYGASSKLEFAAPQLLDLKKDPMGKHLIRIFSVMQKDQVSREFDQTLVQRRAIEWQEFIRYCMLDARLSYALWDQYNWWLTEDEPSYEQVTYDMNVKGWPVDRKSVRRMQARREVNKAQALNDFYDYLGDDSLNLRSLPQLKAFCLERGIRATSFDEEHVAKLLVQVGKKLDSMKGPEPKYHGYREVERLLETKQILGGSSLSKLDTMMNTMHRDAEGVWRVADQYVHAGAAQSMRTSGRSIQMQNLKRLTEDLGEMDTLALVNGGEFHWTNDEMARNLRQVFTSSHPEGQLIVGDLASIESRGLAWQAGEQWKTDAYYNGLEVYKMQAVKIFGIAYDAVTKPQRQTGKVGELSCGYGAGGGAVQGFAAGMGVELSEGEAQKLVTDWRAANPKTVAYWHLLQGMLDGVLTEGTAEVSLDHWYRVVMTLISAPDSIGSPYSSSLVVAMYDAGNVLVLRRIFHGVYRRGSNIAYHKPSEKQAGGAWKQGYIDPKTKQFRFYEIYGGKLAGILTQSLCRELFFAGLRDLAKEVERHSNVDIIGQFHDEIVLDWRPGTRAAISLEEMKWTMHKVMTKERIPGLPMAAEVKSDFRYTK